MNSKPILPLVFLSTILVGCGTENPFARGPRIDADFSDPSAPGTTVSFEEDVVPILTSCIGCHRDGTGGWTYAGSAGAYSAVIEVINLDNPENSELLVKATGGNHGGGALFTASSSSYETILRWIEQGGLDN